jgi:hypothetical protein
MHRAPFPVGTFLGGDDVVELCDVHQDASDVVVDASSPERVEGDMAAVAITYSGKISIGPASIISHALFGTQSISLSEAFVDTAEAGPHLNDTASSMYSLVGSGLVLTEHLDLRSTPPHWTYTANEPDNTTRREQVRRILITAPHGHRGEVLQPPAGTTVDVGWERRQPGWRSTTEILAGDRSSMSVPHRRDSYCATKAAQGSRRKSCEDSKREKPPTLSAFA